MLDQNGSAFIVLLSIDKFLSPLVILVYISVSNIQRVLILHRHTGYIVIFFHFHQSSFQGVSVILFCIYLTIALNIFEMLRAIFIFVCVWMLVCVCMWIVCVFSVSLSLSFFFPCQDFGNLSLKFLSQNFLSKQKMVVQCRDSFDKFLLSRYISSSTW